MDDTTADKHSDQQPPLAPSKAKGLKVRQKEKWQSLQSHLDQALSQWNEISDQMKDELSPDQKRLHEVKQLLTELKVKLEEF